MTEEKFLNYFRKRAADMETVEDLNRYWIHSMGETFKDKPDVIEIFRLRKEEILDGSKGSV